MKLQAITRTDLIKIAQTSEIASTQQVKEFIGDLISRGQYTEATEDEIEELDEIYESLLEAG